MGNPSTSTSLLLDLAVPFRRIDDVLHVEAQAHNGMLRWLDNFHRVTICAPCVPEALVDPTMSWLPVDDLARHPGLTLHELPWGYHPRDHLRQRAEVRALFRRLIPDHRFLCFSNLGWAGAWGNIGASEASRAGRPYAVWLDWVLHHVRPTGDKGIVRRGVKTIRHYLERWLSLSAIRGAALGLFHGQTVYDAYAPISRNPHVVHNVHLKREDQIDRAELAARIERTPTKARIGYVGRVHEMKGPLQWIAAMEALSLSGAMPFEATWLGDGPLLEECRRQVELRGLGDTVFFPGAERDRSRVLAFLRSLDLFAFCHLTQESPRCLIEALMSGVPLVGYDSSYARELVDPTGGGDFVAIGDTAGLARSLGQLLKDGPSRQVMSIAALASGQRFSDDAVFAHRSALIKQGLSGGTAAAAAQDQSSLGHARS